MTKSTKERQNKVDEDENDDKDNKKDKDDKVDTDDIGSYLERFHKTTDVIVSNNR